jgi:hypothetical protein
MARFHPVIRKNDLKRWRTTFGLAVGARVAAPLAGAVAGVVAGLLAPTVATRADANGQAATYGVFLGVAVALLLAFAAVPKLRESRLRAIALVASVMAALAAVAGLLHLPVDLYAYTFAVAVAALVTSVLSLAALFR